MVIRGHVEGPVPQVAPTGPLAVEINRVLSTVLAKSPAQRYPSASAMRDDLERVVRLPDDATPIRVPGRSSAEGPPPTNAAWQRSGPGTPMPSAPPFGPPGTGGVPTAPYRATEAPRSRAGVWVALVVAALALVAVVVVVALLVAGR